MIVFFFQAEDGIRDLYVTGVQTCALPIFHTIYSDEGCSPVPNRFAQNRPAHRQRYKWCGRWQDDEAEASGCLTPLSPVAALIPRSEERRVGKECRSREWPYLQYNEVKRRA